MPYVRLIKIHSVGICDRLSAKVISMFNVSGYVQGQGYKSSSEIAQVAMIQIDGACNMG